MSDTVDELERRATALCVAGQLDAAIGAWEQRHVARLAAGDPVGAARAATHVAFALLLDSHLLAPVRAWAGRAERLLAGHGETPLHPWLGMVRTYERLRCGEVTQARHLAEQTIDVADRHGEVSPATLARVAWARLTVLDGDVDEAIARLDDAAVTVMSDAVDPLVAGMALCELLCAMQDLGQYDRAEQWTGAMERWRLGAPISGLNGRCRVHRAEILRLRGALDAAEGEATRACAQLHSRMQRELGWPLTELGTIRLRRGNLDGAEEAFLDAHRHGWDPQPGLASLRLRQGRADEAAALLTAALERPAATPSVQLPPGSDLHRAPLLEAQVTALLAVGDHDTARAAGAELRAIAQRSRSAALAAGADLADARLALAAGSDGDAVRSAQAAVDAWCAIGAPYEAAGGRLVLAEALAGCRDDHAAQLARRAAHDAWRAMDAPPPPSPTPAKAEKSAAEARPARGDIGLLEAPLVFRRDGDTRVVRFDGRQELLRDLTGMRTLEHLLRHPGRAFHVLALRARDAGRGTAGPPPDQAVLPGSARGHAGALLDAEARRAYRQRLHEVENDIDEATAHGDIDRATQAREERDHLVAELSRAVGLGGRARVAGSPAERARAAVTRSLRYAMRRIGEHHPSLGEHLGHTIRTGTRCGYHPDPRHTMDWQT